MGNAVISFPFLGENFSIDPSRYFTLFGHDFYWYGTIIAVGFLLAVTYCMRRRKEFGITQDNLIDMLLFAVPISIIFARIYYVIFNFSDYRQDPSEIYKIWHGGLAIYGSIIGAVLVVCIFCRVKKIKIGAMLDLGCFGLFIGQIIGRWANFINREAFGGTTDIWCRMGLTTEAGTIYVHPTFLYESLWNLIGFIFLHFYSKKHRRYDGQIFAMYVAWYGLGRFFIEGLRSDSLYLFGTGLRVSQIVALVTFGVAVAYLVYMFTQKENSPDKLYVNVVAAAEQTSAETPSPEEESSEESKGETESEVVGGEELEEGYEYIYIEEPEEDESAPDEPEK